MMRTLRRLLLGIEEPTEELKAIQRQIEVLEHQARRLERDKKVMRIENGVGSRLEWIFAKGQK